MSYILVTPENIVYRGELADLIKVDAPDGVLFCSRSAFPTHQAPSDAIVVTPYGEYINTPDLAAANTLAEQYSDDGIDHQVYVRATYAKDLA